MKKITTTDEITKSDIGAKGMKLHNYLWGKQGNVNEGNQSIKWFHQESRERNV